MTAFFLCPWCPFFMLDAPSSDIHPSPRVSTRKMPKDEWYLDREEVQVAVGGGQGDMESREDTPGQTASVLSSRP